MEQSIAENTQECKGVEKANARLARLIAVFDDVGFRILSVKTNGADFELTVRDLRKD